MDQESLPKHPLDNPIDDAFFEVGWATGAAAVLWILYMLAETMFGELPAYVFPVWVGVWLGWISIVILRLVMATRGYSHNWQHRCVCSLPDPASSDND